DVPGIDLDHCIVEATQLLREQEDSVEERGEHRIRNVSRVDGEARELADFVPLPAQRARLLTVELVGGEAVCGVEPQRHRSGKVPFVVRGERARVRAYERRRRQIAAALVTLA